MQKQGIDSRLLLGLLALAVVTGVVAVIAIGGGKSTAKAKSAGSQFEASGLLTPVQQAPPLQLRDSLGKEVNIASYRGKAVLVTFLYTHCPDICPLITADLHVAQNLLGKNASKVQIIAVSVDPRGDTKSSVAAFLAKHQMTGRMEYLVGTAKELAPVWQAWGVGSERDAASPQFVNHSGLVYGITASGKRLTIYASNFAPSEVAHDVPLLAAR
jgi:protein SCO1/2